MYLNSEVPVLPVRVFGLFSFIHLSHSQVTVPSEATEGAGNCCFTVLLIKIHTVLAMIQAGQHQKQSDLNPAGMVKSELLTVCGSNKEMAPCIRGALRQQKKHWLSLSQHRLQSVGWALVILHSLRQ